MADPVCTVCRDAGRVTPATEVDHIKPRRRGGTDGMDNLQSLCKRHHSQKTGRERGVDNRA